VALLVDPVASDGMSASSVSPDARASLGSDGSVRIDPRSLLVLDDAGRDAAPVAVDRAA
jgi:hypothetical protein